MNCQVPGCLVRYGDGRNIRMRSFPRNDNELASQWMDAIQRDFRHLTKSQLMNKFVCDLHFCDKDRFEAFHNRTNLKRRAVPSLLLPKSCDDAQLKCVINSDKFNNNSSIQNVSLPILHCLMPGCSTKHGDNIGFRVFPLNPKFRAKWEKAAQLDLSNLTTMQLRNKSFCNLHFKDEFEEVPSLLLPPQPLFDIKDPLDITSMTITEATSNNNKVIITTDEPSTYNDVSKPTELNSLKKPAIIIRKISSTNNIKKNIKSRRKKPTGIGLVAEHIEAKDVDTAQTDNSAVILKNQSILKDLILTLNLPTTMDEIKEEPKSPVFVESVDDTMDSVDIVNSQNYIMETPIAELKEHVITNEVPLTPKLFNKICRLCLDVVPTHIDFSTAFYDGETLISLLEKYIGSDICVNQYNDIELPQSICYTCTMNIIASHKFFKKCQETNSLLYAASNKLINDHDYISQPNIKLSTKYTNKNPKYSRADFIKAGIKIVQPFAPRKLIQSLNCNACEMTDFPTMELLKQHKATHRSKEKHILQWKCDICPKVFKRPMTLQAHMRLHTREKPYVCEICGMPFRHYSNLTRHLRIHTGIKSYICDVCGKAFNQSTSLKVHKMIHNVGDFICALCDKHCKTESSYHFHNKWHETHVLCQLCGKYFSRGRYNHHLRHFCKQANTIDRNRHKNIQTYQHKCKECNKTFKLEYQLKRHLVVHTGVKNHKCQMCGRTFSHRNSLLTHIRRHTGEKPYHCTDCDKSFYSSSLRSIHKCAADKLDGNDFL